MNIDPPYNTGNKDFMYDDNYIESDDGYRHSKWLSFMGERLVIARELLAETGFIMISIDESESAQLRLLCDKVFGEDNFQTTIHVQVRYAQKSLTDEKAFKPGICQVSCRIFCANSSLLTGLSETQSM
jgi:adenine-specific DNA-methyltransferase